MNDDYSDIINLPHFHAEDKPYMDEIERAAQFSAFDPFDFSSSGT